MKLPKFQTAPGMQCNREWKIWYQQLEHLILSAWKVFRWQARPVRLSRVRPIRIMHCLSAMPQAKIAVSVRIANGYNSSYTAEIGRDIVKYKYHLGDTEDIVTGSASMLGVAGAGD